MAHFLRRTALACLPLCRGRACPARVAVHQAKTNLSRLLALVERGEQVTIMRGSEPVADLVRHRRKTGSRILGALAGTISLPEGWDAPMTNEQADRFLEGKEW